MRSPVTDEREWVLLVECYSAQELHLVRASLEARGVPCKIHGEQTHGVLGPIQGAVAPPRVFVPQGGLSIARELVEDIVGPFESSMEEDEDGEVGSPFRRASSTPSEDEPELPVVRRKSFAVLVLIGAMSVAPLMGLSHVYVGKTTRAGLLLLTSVLSILLMARGAGWAGLLLGGVWLADLVGGALAIAEHNRAVQALEAARPDEDEDEDEDEEADEEADEDEEA